MNVLVYCGSRPGSSDQIRDATITLANAITSNGHGLVYGGGSVGLMGIIARAVLDAGSHVLGVIPTFLSTDEVVLKECTELIEVESMHARKLLMIERSDVIVTLPGGFGSMDELFEAVTWLQLGLHDKPIGLVNVDGFYDHLVSQLDTMVKHGFLTTRNRDLIYIDENPDRLLEHLLHRATTGVSNRLERRS